MKKKFSISRENTCAGIMLYFFIRFFVAPIIRLVWLKEVSGKENVPSKGAFIVAANHQSFLDFILLYSVLPGKRLRFLAAEKFYHSKYSRALMELTGQIKVDRYDKSSASKDEAVQKGLSVLKAGEVLAIFPQGTRSRSGKIEKTFSGVARFAVLSGAPVVPLGIRGAFEAWPPHAKKPVFKKQVSLHFGEPMSFGDAKDSFGDDLSHEKLRMRTNKIMKKIAQLSAKDYKEE